MSEPGRGLSPGKRPTLSAEDAVELPMPLHRITDGHVVCDAPELSVCRLACAEDCGSETWPCGGYDENDNEAPQHEMADMGECNVVLFIEASGDLWDSADLGSNLPVTAHMGPPPDGRIVCTWVSDYYEWRYADPDEQDDPQVTTPARTPS